MVGEGTVVSALSAFATSGSNLSHNIPPKTEKSRRTSFCFADRLGPQSIALQKRTHKVSACLSSSQSPFHNEDKVHFFAQKNKQAF